MSFLRLIPAAAALAIAVSASGTASAAPTSLTLGTQGGPMPDPTRSQPANALLTDDAVIVVDAGDGVAEQLAKAGIPLARVRFVLLSHLHFDHTAGMFGLMALRWQTNIKEPLTIYGPPGTRKLFDGLLAAMGPAVAAGYAYAGERRGTFDHGVEVVEIRDSTAFNVGATHVIAAKNSHYCFHAGSEEDHNYESLAYRFENRERTIVYTGDTGPSEAVTKLARGADLLVSEMIDFDRTVAEIRRVSPNLSEAALGGLMTHLRDHHLTPVQVGELARASGVKSVVVTHISSPQIDASVAVEYLDGIAANYQGAVVLARDSDEF